MEQEVAVEEEAEEGGVAEAEAGVIVHQTLNLGAYILATGE